MSQQPPHPQALPPASRVADELHRAFDLILGRGTGSSAHATTHELLNIGMAFVRFGMNLWVKAGISRGAAHELFHRALETYECPCATCEQQRAKAQCTGPGGDA